MKSLIERYNEAKEDPHPTMNASSEAKVCYELNTIHFLLP